MKLNYQSQITDSRPFQKISYFQYLDGLDHLNRSQESLEIFLEFIFDHKRCGLAIAEKKVETFIIIMMAKHRFSRRFMTTGPLCNEFLLSPHHFQVRAC